MLIRIQLYQKLRILIMRLLTCIGVYKDDINMVHLLGR